MVYPVKYLNDNGIVHKDLKADNIFVDNMGRIKITDYSKVILVESLNH